MKILKALAAVWLTLILIFIAVVLGHQAMEDPVYLLVLLVGVILSLITTISINILTGQV